MYSPVLTSVLVLAAKIPPKLIVIPATVVAATRVTVSPLLIVIESVVCGVVLLQAVQVAATLKLPPPIPLEEQLKALTPEKEAKKRKIVRNNPNTIFL